MIDALLDELFSSMVFYKLNLRLGYHQVKVAWSGQDNLSELLVMHIRLTNALATFQVLMTYIVKPFL